VDADGGPGLAGLKLTDSPFLLGLTALLQLGPVLLLSVSTGVVADRLVRRNT
jgi:hypothetical protein